ncbi:hypothetical protein H632_c5042p0, partial [Helicosporidium sp. ATCC 50920]
SVHRTSRTRARAAFTTWRRSSSSRGRWAPHSSFPTTTRGLEMQALDRSTIWTTRTWRRTLRARSTRRRTSSWSRCPTKSPNPSAAARLPNPLLQRRWTPRRRRPRLRGSPRRVRRRLRRCGRFWPGSCSSATATPCSAFPAGPGPGCWPLRTRPCSARPRTRLPRPKRRK